MERDGNGRHQAHGDDIHDLLGGPLGGAMLVHVEVKDAPPMVREDDQNEEHTQLTGG